MISVTRSLLGAQPWSFSVERKKDLKAEFERVALPQLSRLYTSALYLTKDEAEAEDLVQETYLRAFRFFDKFQPGTNCRAWMLSILQNLFINCYRQKKRQVETVDWENIDEVYDSMVQSDDGRKTNPEDVLAFQDMDDDVQRALRGLPEEFRMAVVLVDIEELRYEEAGRVMGCPIGTVRSRVARGRRLLQVALKDYALQRGTAPAEGGGQI